MKNFFAKIGILIIVLTITGCTTFRPVQTAASASNGGGPNLSQEQRERQLASITQWRIQSVFSILYRGKLTMAYLTWQQSGDRFYQRVSGPFNLGGVRIEGNRNAVTMWKSPQQVVTASSPEKLLTEQLGLRLPVSNLYYWVRDLAVPGLPAQKRYDNRNHLVTLQQGGWHINYNSFVNVNGIDLPNRIVMVNPELNIKLVIKQWNIS